MLTMFSQWFVSKRRKLTAGEIDFAKTIFANHIDYAKVEIIVHRLVMPHYAISPNGHIYFNRQDWKADFSQESLELQSWLIHEMRMYGKCNRVFPSSKKHYSIVAINM